MTYKNTKFRFIARATLLLFLMNVTAPTLQFAFADSTRYYVSASGWSDANDGLTPATAWQTLAKVSATTLLQWDEVSLLCTDTWNEALTIGAVGTVGLPILIDSYGVWCGTSKPKIDRINISGSSYINIAGLSLTKPTIANTINIVSSDNISLSNNTISNTSGICLNMSGNNGLVTVTGNTFSGCTYGVNIANTSVDINTNTFSTISQDAITISGNLAGAVSQNTFTNIAQNGIIYGQDINVNQNTLTNTCSTGSYLCAAIKNDPTLSGTTVSAIVTQNTISGVGTGISGTGSYGIYTSNIAWAQINQNNIINAETALGIADSHNLFVESNVILTSRARSLLVTQDTLGATHTNYFGNNTILQKNPDYPYIEIRDNVPTSNNASAFLDAQVNTIYPNYKPNTSYVRLVNFGGYTTEYTKSTLNQFDPSVTLFEYFAYKPYVNTGSFATANLLSNPNFDTNTTSWSVSADTGLAPSLSYNPTGSHLGGSATITPSGGSPDRMWMTSSDTLSVTAGQTYLVSGYAKSDIGNINLRAFLHQSGNPANVYSDRIAETYATASGRSFSFYITIKTTASDANLSFETSNQVVAYELDSLSIRRMNAVVKNTNTQETLIFSNTGSASYDQACPGGAACFAYVDGINTAIAWPTTIPAYTTRFVLLNNSPNILNTPSCTINISAGSVPTGQPVTIDWTTTNSLSQTLSYPTYTGSMSYAVSSTGVATFIPPYDNNSTISLDTINDVWPRLCSIQVTTTNTSPNIYSSTTLGLEDDPQIDGTLSGVDLNPGDSIFFEQFGGVNPAHGILNVDSSGSFQYYPDADFCGDDIFSFRASDQLGHHADPVDHTISVGCVNDTPVAVNDSASATSGIWLMIDVLANDTDVDMPYQTQVFTLNNVSNAAHGTVSINANQLFYTANIGYSGSEVLTYRLVDQSGALSNTGTLNITVTRPNTPPTATSTGYTFNEDTTLSSSLTGSDAEGDTLTYTASTLPTHGVLTLLPSGAFTYTPAANYFGTDSFTFTARDGVFTSAPATVTLTISAVPDAPVTSPDSYTLSQDTSITALVMNNDTDVDSSVFTFTGYTNPAHGTLSVSGTGLLYTPDAGYSGPDSFSYRIMDETNLVSNLSTVTLSVTSTNQAPTANGWIHSVNEDSILGASLIASDPEWSTLTYIVDILPTQGTLTVSGTGGFTYTPAPNYFGTDSFTYHVSDGVLASSGATINITVNSINDIPLADGQTLSALGNSAASSGNITSGLVTGSDIESPVLTFTATTLPVHGILSMSSTGGFTYQPALGYVGPDSFSFAVSDGLAQSTPAVVSITVIDNGVIPPPPTLDHLTLIAPTSVYVGQAWSVTVQAKDNTNANIVTYTGSILFSSNTDSGATLPWNGNPIAFSVFDSGTKTFTNGVNFTQTGSMNLQIQDMNTGLSTAVTIAVLDTPPVVIPPVSTGWGGGGGQNAPVVKYTVISVTSSGKVTQGVPPKDPIFNSAPLVEPETVFVIDDPTGLLGQLFLTNRYLWGTLSAAGPETPLEWYSTWAQYRASFTGAKEIIDSIKDIPLDDMYGPSVLRQIVRLFIDEADQTDDPVTLYDYAIEQITARDLSESDRLYFTQKYLIRLLELEKKKYEEQVYRLSSARSEERFEPASN